MTFAEVIIELRFHRSREAQPMGAAGSYIDHKGRQRSISLGMRYGQGVTSERNAPQEEPARASNAVRKWDELTGQAPAQAEAPPFEANCAPDHRYWVNPATGWTERRP